MLQSPLTVEHAYTSGVAAAAHVPQPLSIFVESSVLKEEGGLLNLIVILINIYYIIQNMNIILRTCLIL